MATIYCVWGEAIEEHRKDSRILSKSGETEKRCKTGSKGKRYVKYSGIGVVAAVDVTKIRESHTSGRGSGVG